MDPGNGGDGSRADVMSRDSRPRDPPGAPARERRGQRPRRRHPDARPGIGLGSQTERQYAQPNLPTPFTTILTTCTGKLPDNNLKFFNLWKTPLSLEIPTFPPLLPKISHFNSLVQPNSPQISNLHQPVTSNQPTPGTASPFVSPASAMQRPEARERDWAKPLA